MMSVEPNLAWKDTVLVRSDETVDIMLEVTNPGLWMAHCHIAEHSQGGMMFSFPVRELWLGACTCSRTGIVLRRRSGGSQSRRLVGGELRRVDGMRGEVAPGDERAKCGDAGGDDRRS